MTKKKEKEMSREMRVSNVGVKVRHGFQAHHQCALMMCLLPASPPPVSMVVLQRAAAAAVFALPRPPLPLPRISLVSISATDPQVAPVARS